MEVYRSLSAANERGHHRFDWNFKKSNGADLFVEVTLTPVRLHTGTAMLAVWRDQSKKAAELALRKNSEHFQQLCAMAPVGIFFTDPRGECLYVNPKWQETAGLSLLQGLGQGWVRAIHPDERQSVLDAWSSSIELKQPFSQEIRWLRPSGEVRCTIARAMALTNSAGECTG